MVEVNNRFRSDKQKELKKNVNRALLQIILRKEKTALL